MIRQGLVYLLQREPAVYGLCRSRIFPNRAPQARNTADPNDPGIMPRITMKRISRRGVSSQDGATGLAFARVELRCWGNDDDEADALAEAVRQASLNGQRLDGWKQTQMGPCFVRRIHLAEIMDDFEPDLHAGEQGHPYIVIDAECWYTERR